MSKELLSLFYRKFGYLYKYLYFIGVKYNIALWNTLFPITFGFNENFSFTIAWEA